MATPSPSSTPSRTKGHNNNRSNSNSNSKNNRKRASNNNEDDADPPTPPSSAASPRQSHRLPLLVNPLPIHLLLAGWNRLESVPRWMMERTLGVVLPTVIHQQHHQHQQRHASAMVQQVLEQDNDRYNDLFLMVDVEALKVKYAKVIRNNGEIQSLQKQIRGLRQQLQQQRTLRERLEKKRAMWRDKEQKQLQHLTHKLHHALELMAGSNSSNKTNGSYSKALLTATRGGTKSNKRTSTSTSSSSNMTITAAASMVHTIATSPMTLMAALPTSSSSTLMTLQQLSPLEKEALTLESDILRTMHYTMVYQNQCDLLEASTKQVTSGLKRERGILDTQQAEVTVMQMVLDGTQRAMQDLYQDIVLRQEILLERILQQQHQQQSARCLLLYSSQDSSSNSSIPRLIAPTRLHSLMRRQATASSLSDPFGSNRSFVLIPSDGISDLGDSINRGSGDSMTDGSSSIGDVSFQNHGPTPSKGLCYAAGPPVFTSVQALQRHTLQNMAGVESF